MKTGFINGELVYVLESPGHIYNNEIHSRTEVQIIKHRDLVRMLNKLFKKVENMDTSEKAAVFGAGFKMFQVLDIFAGCHAGNYRIPIEIKDKEAFVSDDLKKIEKKRMPRLFNWKSIMKNRVEGTGVKEIGQFKVYRGGLLKGF